MPSPNGISSILIAGGIKGDTPISAGLGSKVAAELLARGDVKVTVIARVASASSAAAQALNNAGAQVLAVDYADPSSLAEALKEVDVVLSFLAHDGIIGAQQSLAKASKAAGVKLFVPSEYGTSAIGQPPTSPIYSKTAMQAVLKELELPHAIIPSGGLADWISIFFGAKDDKVTITGTGEEPISFTSFQDVARFVAHVSTTIPLSKLANKVLAIEGSRRTWNDVIAAYNKAHSTTLEVTYESADDALKRWEEKHDFVGWVKAQAVLGSGLSDLNGKPEGNKLWDEWKPKDVLEFI